MHLAGGRCHLAPSPPRNTNGWENVLGEIVSRQNSAYPLRRVYLILAIGLKWMPFLWDPEAPLNPAGSPLYIQMANGQGSWPVDPRIHNLQGQRGELVVVTGQAYSLDFWTLDQGGNPANLNDLVFLENYFALVRTTQYRGENPPGF